MIIFLHCIVAFFISSGTEESLEIIFHPSFRGLPAVIS